MALASKRLEDKEQWPWSQVLGHCRLHVSHPILMTIYTICSQWVLNT